MVVLLTSCPQNLWYMTYGRLYVKFTEKALFTCPVIGYEYELLDARDHVNAHASAEDNHNIVQVLTLYRVDTSKITASISKRSTRRASHSTHAN